MGFGARQGLVELAQRVVEHGQVQNVTLLADEVARDRDAARRLG